MCSVRRFCLIERSEFVIEDIYFSISLYIKYFSFVFVLKNLSIETKILNFELSFFGFILS